MNCDQYISLLPFFIFVLENINLVIRISVEFSSCIETVSQMKRSSACRYTEALHIVDQHSKFVVAVSSTVLCMRKKEL